MFLGSQGRFSTDLDFTGIEEHDHEDVILAMMEAFEQPFRPVLARAGSDPVMPGTPRHREDGSDRLCWGIARSSVPHPPC